VFFAFFAFWRLDVPRKLRPPRRAALAIRADGGFRIRSLFTASLLATRYVVASRFARTIRPQAGGETLGYLSDGESAGAWADCSHSSTCFATAFFDGNVLLPRSSLPFSWLLFPRETLDGALSL